MEFLVERAEIAEGILICSKLEDIWVVWWYFGEHANQAFGYIGLCGAEVQGGSVKERSHAGCGKFARWEAFRKNADPTPDCHPRKDAELTGRRRFCAKHVCRQGGEEERADNEAKVIVGLGAVYCGSVACKGAGLVHKHHFGVYGRAGRRWLLLVVMDHVHGCQAEDTVHEKGFLEGVLDDSVLENVADEVDAIGGNKRLVCASVVIPEETELGGITGGKDGSRVGDGAR